MVVSLCAERARIEPLILEGAEMRRPVFAAYTKGGRRLHVGLQEMGTCPPCMRVPTRLQLAFTESLLTFPLALFLSSFACMLREALPLSRMQSERRAGGHHTT